MYAAMLQEDVGIIKSLAKRCLRSDLGNGKCQNNKDILLWCDGFVLGLAETVASQEKGVDSVTLPSHKPLITKTI